LRARPDSAHPSPAPTLTHIPLPCRIVLNIDSNRAVFGRPYPPKQSVTQLMMACLSTGTAKEDDPKTPVFKERKTHSSRESFFRSLYGRRPRAFEHPTDLGSADEVKRLTREMKANAPSPMLGRLPPANEAPTVLTTAWSLFAATTLDDEEGSTAGHSTTIGGKVMMMQTVPGVLGKKGKGWNVSGKKKKSNLQAMAANLAEMDAPWVASSTAFNAVEEEIKKIKSMIPGKKKKSRA